jgi:hypothetical protein
LRDQVLAPDDLGAFILVLANASLDPTIRDALRERLGRDYLNWSRRLREASEGGVNPVFPADDLAVLEQLFDSDLAIPGATSSRRAGPWELQFNPVRALRPARASGAVVDRLREPFNVAGFHFNKPYLRREILWEGELLGDRVRLLYNKFPFAELHGLLVRGPGRQQPQFLEQQDHWAVWSYCALLGRTLNGLGIAYNAYGAYASVNHQHFQFYVRATGEYPLEQGRWSHNGGSRGYPLPCHVFTGPGEAWRCLADLHASNRTYNLLYRPGRVYIVPRAFQGSYRHAGWTGGFAWSEVAGAVTVSRRADFRALDEASIEAELCKLLEPEGKTRVAPPVQDDRRAGRFRP